MGSGRHAGRSLLGRQAGAQREAAADALGDRHDVGRDAGPFMGEELAGAADAALHLVEDQQDAMLVAELAQAAQALRRHRADAALALHRFDQDAGGLRPDGGLQRIVVAKGHLIEAFDLRPEAFEIFGLAAGGDGGQRAAVEGALRR